MPRALLHRLLATASLAFLALAPGCGLCGSMSFAEIKRELAGLVDDTYEKALADFAPRRFPQNATPCREGQGAGGATGDYAPGGALEFDVPGGEKGKRAVLRVKEYWEERGFEAIQLVPSGEAVFARTDGYRLAFEITPEQGRGKLGAGGPCAKPESKKELAEPPAFRSLR